MKPVTVYAASGVAYSRDEIVAVLERTAPQPTPPPPQREEKPQHDEPQAGAAGDDIAVQAARRYLARIPESVSGQGGHKLLYWAARAMVRGFKVSTHRSRAPTAGARLGPHFPENSGSGLRRCA